MGKAVFMVALLFIVITLVVPPLRKFIWPVLILGAAGIALSEWLAF